MSLSFETAADEAVLRPDTTNLSGDAEQAADAVFEQVDTVDEIQMVEVSGEVRPLNPFDGLIAAAQSLRESAWKTREWQTTGDWFNDQDQGSGQIPFGD